MTLLSEVSPKASGSQSDDCEVLMAAIARCVAQLEAPAPQAGAATGVIAKLAPVLLLLLQHPSPNQHLAQQVKHTKRSQELDKI